MRIAFIALPCALLGALARPAAAADMENHDLASLVFLSTDVVQGDELATTAPKDQPWNGVTTFRVTRAVKGALKAGATIAVWDGIYSLELPATWMAGKSTPAPKREPRALLFLTKGQDGKYGKVPSGMRVFAAGRVYRFEQFNNPGGYDPTPQGADPLDAFGRDPDLGAPITEAAFEPMLAKAVTRAAAVTRLLAETDPTTRRRDLLAALPPPRHFPEPYRYSQTRGADAIGRALLDAIWATQDGPTIVASLGRDVPLLFGRFRRSDNGLDQAARQRLAALLLATAQNAKAPLHQRVGALEQLSEWLDFEPPAFQRGLADLSPLLSDPEPVVRAAAAAAIADRGLPNRMLARRPLLAALKTELDGGVLVALGQALERLESLKAFFAALPKGRVALLATAIPGSAPGRIDVSYSDVSQQPPTIVGAHLVQGGKPVTLGAPEIVTSGRSTFSGDGIARFKPASALTPGRYDLVLEYRIGKRALTAQAIAIDVR